MNRSLVLLKWLVQKTWYIDSRIGSHCGQFDVDLLVDFVNTGEALGWGELVLVTELSGGEVVVLSDGGVLSLTGHHQGGYPTVQEMFLQVRDNQLQVQCETKILYNNYRSTYLLNILNKHFETNTLYQSLYLPNTFWHRTQRF